MFCFINSITVIKYDNFLPPNDIIPKNNFDYGDNTV